MVAWYVLVVVGFISSTVAEGDASQLLKHEAIGACGSMPLELWLASSAWDESCFNKLRKCGHTFSLASYCLRSMRKFVRHDPLPCKDAAVEEASVITVPGSSVNEIERHCCAPVSQLAAARCFGVSISWLRFLSCFKAILSEQLRVVVSYTSVVFSSLRSAGQPGWARPVQALKRSEKLGAGHGKLLSRTCKFLQRPHEAQAS